MVMIVREAQAKDKKDISDLYYQLYPHYKGPKKPIPIEKSQSKSLLFVAEKENKIVGFIWGNFINYGISRYGYIDEIFVKQKFRGEGVGASLLRRMLKGFKKLKVWSVFVSIGKRNKKALSFYRKLGFKPCKGLWFYWEPAQKR